MKNAIFALGALLMASQVFAGNGYCDSRPSNRDRQNCYQNAVESNVAVMKQSYQYLMASTKITQQQKQQLQQEQSAWGDRVGRACGDNIYCLYEASAERSMHLRALTTRY